MEEKPFRVLLDFSEVNTNISGLKYVWMHISPRELNTINDFKQAIIRKFSFTQESFRLLVRDGLLLESEKIAVLREDDTVKIQLETSMECSTVDTGINVSSAEASSHSLSTNAVSFNKSRKRKSETFISTLRESETDLSANITKKKKKQDKSVHISNELNNFSKSYDSVNLLHEDLSSLDKNTKSNVSHNKNKNNKQSVKNKKKPFPKTPTSDFITFAVKLSEAERNNQNVCQSDVNGKNVEYSVSDTNLYKTAVSKTNLSPIPERSTYLLSSSQTPLNLTESLNNSKNQDDGQNLVFEEVVGAKSGVKKRRRKRKRKAIPSTECLGLSADATSEMEGSILADVTSNETYNTSSDTRKHIIFRSPTPPITNMSLTLDSDLNNSDEPKVLPVENNLKSNSELESAKNKSFKEGAQLDVKFEKDSETVINESGDFTKESTPFSKKKLKGKSWGVTPLPRIGSSSNTFSVENRDIPDTDIKPTYQNCTPLNSLPPVGTRMAYKILELNEDYCPEITEYKEGILRKVDPNTDELEIELIQEEIKPGKSGKFENMWNDEPPPDEIIKTVSLNWSALINPLLIPQ